MRTPDYSVLSELTAWQSEHGVVSVYLGIDHSERRQGWQTGLRDGLKGLIDQARAEGPRGRWQALQASAESIIGHFTKDGALPRGRCQIAFVEVSERGGRQVFYEAQLPPRRSMIVYQSEPHLLPLLALLGDGSPLGVVCVSAGRVRLWEWRLGEADSLDEWQFTQSGDSHERKGPALRDPARGQMTTSSGRDQFGQHLDAQRERFLRLSGDALMGYARERQWREILGFGEEPYWRRLRDGFGHEQRFVHVDSHNVIQEDEAQICQRVEQLLARLNRSHQLSLVRQAQNAVYAEGGRRGAVGLQDTIAALAEGRVEQLLLDASASFDRAVVNPRVVAELKHARPGKAGLCEQMVEQAIETKATVTALEGEAAQALAHSQGAAAILRY